MFIFIFPGFTLVNAVFPRKGELDEELDMLYRLSYGLALSVALTVVLGFFLGAILPSSGSTGYFIGRNIWLALVSLTIIFFFVGWYRGAYRCMRYIHPSLEREPEGKSRGVERETEEIKELQRLTKQHNALKQKIKKVEKKIKKGSGDMKGDYEEKRDKLEKRFEKVDEELKEAEKRIEKEF